MVGESRGSKNNPEANHAHRGRQPPDRDLHPYPLRLEWIPGALLTFMRRMGGMVKRSAAMISGCFLAASNMLAPVFDGLEHTTPRFRVDGALD